MLKTLKLTVVALALSYAFNSHASNSLGGQDGGGGLGHSSTPEQVRAAINKAFTIIALKDYYSNIYVRFWIKWTGAIYVVGDLRDPSPVFPELKRNWSDESLTEDERKIPLAINGEDLRPEIQSPPIEALLRNPRVLLAEGDCNQSSRAHADASTDSYDLNGKLCLSVGNLTRLPPDSLLPEIMGLLLHEALHLAGVRDEGRAELWQREFVNYFWARFGALNGTQILNKTRGELSAARFYLLYAEQLNFSKPGDIRTLLVLGAFGRGLSLLPHFLDPLALDLALNPKRPDLVHVYSNSVLALYNLAKSETYYNQNPQLMNPHRIARLISELKKRLEEIDSNFNFYVKGEPREGFPSDRPVCRLIGANFEDEINLDQGNIIINWSENRPTPLIPPQECPPGIDHPKDPSWVSHNQAKEPNMIRSYFNMKIDRKTFCHPLPGFTPPQECAR